MSSRDINQKKIATVCYLIFKLAMRVGDERIRMRQIPLEPLP